MRLTTKVLFIPASLSLAAAIGWAAFSGPAALAAQSVGAAAVSTPPTPGYSCRDISAHQGKTGFSISAAFDGLTVTLAGKLSNTFGMITGTGAALTINSGPHRWSVAGLPPKDAEIMFGAGVTSQGDELCVLRFGTEAYPEVLAQYYTGGAHCCFVPVVYAYQGGAYRATASLGEDLAAKPSAATPAYDPNGGLGPELVDGSLVLRTDDGRFDYQFACFACGGGPIRILTYAAGRFVDVTARYPTEVRADAASWWNAVISGLKSKPPQVLGLVAPWVADECQLGRSATAWATVASLETKGALDPGAGMGFDGVAAAYVKNLRAFLAKLGYCA